MTRRSTRFLALAVHLILLIGLLTACSSGTPTGKTTHNDSSSATFIKIAADLPVNGADSSSSQAIENGTRMAIDQANASQLLPGYTFVFDLQNDADVSGHANPAIGAENVTTLINDAEVAGIIGPFNSAVAQDELSITNAAPLVQIGPTSTNICLTQNTIDTGCIGPDNLLPKLRPTNKVTYFRVAAPNSDQGSVGADYAYQTLKYKTAFVIDDSTLDGMGLANAFATEYKIDGGTILGQDSMAATTDYARELTQIAHLRPAVVYFGGGNETSALAMRKLMVNTPGLEQTPLMGGDSLNTSAFVAAPGAMSGGPVYSTVAVADASKNPAATSFTAQYKTSYGPLGAYSASSYDSTEILLNAIKAVIQAGTKVPANSNDADTARVFRQAVIDQIALTVYSGITGEQSFDANGDTTNKTITIYQLTTASGSPAWKYVTKKTPIS